MIWRYWGRIFTAFILLKAAQSVMKEAEQLLGDNLSTKESPVDTIESTAVDVPEVEADGETVTDSPNGTIDAGVELHG